MEGTVESVEAEGNEIVRRPDAHRTFTTLLIETPPLPKGKRAYTDGVTGRWKMRPWCVPSDISIRSLENFLRNRLRLPDFLVLLLDGKRIAPECTIKRIESIIASQRPLGRAPRLMLEYQRSPRHGYGCPGERSGSFSRPIQTSEGLAKSDACVRKCGYYGATWWRGLCSGCFLQENFASNPNEKLPPPRSAWHVTPLDPHRIQRAAALWSGGLPGELVRVIIQHLCLPPPTFVGEH